MNEIIKTFARKLAPVAGFRNIIVHQYLDFDWNLIYQYLNDLSNFYKFIEYIEIWIKEDKK